MLCLTNIGFVQYFSFGSRKVSYALLLRLALVRTLFCVFCLTNTGFVQCYSLGSRQVRCMLVFILLYSVIFCFACFASPTSGLCSAFPLQLPLWFSLLYSVCFCYACFAQQAPVCAMIFSPAPLEFARFCFVLFGFKFGFYVLSLTNLIFLRFP